MSEKKILLTVSAILTVVILPSCVPYQEDLQWQQQNQRRIQQNGLRQDVVTPQEEAKAKLEAERQKELDAKRAKLRKQERERRRALDAENDQENSLSDKPKNREMANNSENSTTEPEKPKPSAPKSYPTATAIPGKPGYVFSPYNNKTVDVQGIRSGTLVADPHYPATDGKRFRVP